MIVWWTAPALAANLERVLGDVLEEPALAGASYGLVVWGEDGEERVAFDASRRLIPASTAKWVTAAVAADTLSLDHQFTTRVGATGYTEGAVLIGDLVLKGGGDPSFGDPDPRAVVAQIVQIVRDVGVERIVGSVVVDASAFDGPPHGPGWMWDDLRFAYSAPYGATNIGHNLLVDGIACEAQNGPGTPLVDPALCLGTAVHDALVDNGIPVDGVAVRSVPEAVTLAVLPSAPLRDLVRKMLVESDNLYAECILRALDRSEPEEDGVARDRVTEVLQAAGVAPGGVKLVDGSGLSRYSQVSAEAMVRIAAWIPQQPWGPELVSLLPVAGREGTLQGRMVGTAAEGQVRAKTGSMSGVRNIVGYVRSAGGEELVFAMLLNGLAVPPSEAIAVQDRVMALLAASKGRRVPRRVVAALAPSEG